jgi:hypothetical protein
LIIIGTSLQVQPFASLIDDVPEHVPRLLINKELAGVHKSRSTGFDFDWKNGLNRDVAYLGTCDEGVDKLAALLGWDKELEKMFTKGHEKLKAIWKAEIEIKKIAEEKENEINIEQKEDKEVDKLADVLGKLTTENVEEKVDSNEQKKPEKEKEDKEVDKLADVLGELTTENVEEKLNSNEQKKPEKKKEEPRKPVTRSETKKNRT